NRAAIWIDHHKAFVFDYLADGIHERMMESKGDGQKSKEHLKKFYHELAQSIKNSDCVLVMGPGLAKEEFRNHCQDHHPGLAKAIVAVESVKDHASQAEMLQASNAFFKKYSNWEGL